ncbi:MAG: T9SS type A sorting domain-containing protein [Saprospiraceae bacterium]|nr:T9SS type A sorting domain-containing protein [Saprospiraceae bacterium]
MKSLYPLLFLLIPLMTNAQAWTSFSPFNDSLGVYAISLQGDQTAWILGCRNDGHDLELVAHTSDGGASWEDISLPISEEYHFYGIPTYVKGTSIMVVGLHTGAPLVGNNQTWVSKNHGETWTQISSGEIIGWPAFNSPTNGWAGEWGPIIPSDNNTRVFKYNGSPLVGVLSPESLNATVNIGPNPATNWIQLDISGKEPEDFWILVNDLNGQLVQKFEVKSVTQYSHTLQLGALPSAPYLITVSNQKGGSTWQILKN